MSTSSKIIVWFLTNPAGVPSCFSTALIADTVNGASSIVNDSISGSGDNCSGTTRDSMVACGNVIDLILIGISDRFNFISST